MEYGPPNRVWFWTGIGWSSREWESGERAEYIRDVLRPTGKEAKRELALAEAEISVEQAA
jgi:hypothetical protein